MAEGPEQPPISGFRGAERARDRIGHAGEHLSGSHGAFAPSAVGRGAEEALLDQVFFPLASPAFAAFRDMLDKTPAPTERLRRLLLTKAPWE